MKAAQFQELIQRNLLKCTLCPHYCSIAEGKSGRCQVRVNLDGDLYLKTYGIISSMGFDPVEKKPLYHFYPGKYIFSIGSYGCNLKCRFCQNWEISQVVPETFNRQKRYSPEELIKIASERRDNIGIAFTYNEPVIWYEFVMDTARLAKEKGLKTVMVSNGFVNPEPLENLLEVIDAWNVDLKAFTDDFYKNQTFSTLEPVLKSLVAIKQKNRHLEITNLIIPGLNDQTKSFIEMVRWIAQNLGKETVLHLSRYFPNYKLNLPPTPLDKLEQLYIQARQYLDFVYLGNVITQNGQNTLCNSCGETLIIRNRYNIYLDGITKKGECKNCGKKSPIVL